MRLNDTNRRRSLRRRRKLMPDPRRAFIDTSPEASQTGPQVLSENPVWRNRADTATPMSELQETLEEAPSVQH